MDAAGPDDAALARAALSGDETAFAELVRRHRSRVFRLASRFARGREELDDVCQEIFIRAWRRLETWRSDAPFEHWLSRIAVRCCYDRLRSRRRLPETVPIETWNERGGEAGPGGASREEAREACEILDWGLARLEARDRLVLVLLELEERSVKEIALLTGWSESNVKVRALRARARLRKILEVRGVR